jgi:predicted nucleotidyltransferase
MQVKNNWQEKLDIFTKDFEHMPSVIGILVCGSYITGSPTNHSDLDVHMVLDNSVNFRESGNKVIDGLLIE